MRRLVWFALFLGAFGIAGLMFRATIKRADADYLGYALTDAYVRVKKGQSWARAEPLRSGLIYGWAVFDRSGAMRIAHALGAWQNDRQRNTVTALQKSLAQGFAIVEVDLVLGTDGRLYCYHGAGGSTERVQPAQAMHLCRLETLVGEMERTQFALMLDLKSDFRLSAAEVARAIPASLRSRVIFQLYSPGDIAIFNRLPPGFAGPVVTLYRTMRTVHHLDPALDRIGARVVTLPLSRMGEFSRWGRRPNRILLTHPIEDCGVFSDVVQRGFAGGYMDSGLNCAIAAR